MSFSFSAKGKRDSVIQELDALTATQLGQDRLGGDVRDLLVNSLGRSADVQPDQQFNVSAFGHAGSTDYESIVTLGVTVSIESNPNVTTPPNTATTATTVAEGSASPTGAGGGGGSTWEDKPAETSGTPSS